MIAVDPLLERDDSNLTAGARKSKHLDWHRFNKSEILPWIFAVAVFFLFPDDRSLATSIIIMALAALALDLALGFAGILSLGHAIFVGTGAYVAAFLALAGWDEPITGALASGLSASLLAFVIGPLVVRQSGLAQIMITLTLALIAYEVANKATWLTGGDDGLGGIDLAPVFGIFRWSVYGETAYVYALSWLFILFILTRRLVSSPFGLALHGFRENANRMMFIGAPIHWHLLRVYVISAFMAGIAGALTAQTTKFVSLSVFNLTLSVDLLVMVILGGVGRLYGAVVGAAVYMCVHHFAAEWNPYHWMFVIGGFLIIAVRFGSGGILGSLDTLGRGLVKGRPR